MLTCAAPTSLGAATRLSGTTALLFWCTLFWTEKALKNFIASSRTSSNNFIIFRLRGERGGTPPSSVTGRLAAAAAAAAEEDSCPPQTAEDSCPPQTDVVVVVADVVAVDGSDVALYYLWELRDVHWRPIDEAPYDFLADLSDLVHEQTNRGVVRQSSALRQRTFQSL